MRPNSAPQAVLVGAIALLSHLACGEKIFFNQIAARTSPSPIHPSGEFTIRILFGIVIDQRGRHCGSGVLLDANDWREFLETTAQTVPIRCVNWVAGASPGTLIMYLGTSIARITLGAVSEKVARDDSSAGKVRFQGRGRPASIASSTSPDLD